MQFFRRQALRAINSSVSAQRSISTRTPFVLRSKPQPLSAIVSRRFASNDVDAQATQAPEADSSPSSSSAPASADQDDSSSIKSAIDSATESASTYASDAAEVASETYESAKEKVVDAAQAAGAAAGLSAPRSRDYNTSGRDQARQSFERPVISPNNNVYIGNLSFDATAEDLKQHFSSEGEILNAKLATDYNGLSKGFGYIQFATVEQASAAIANKSETEFMGRRLMVNYQTKGSSAPRTPAEPSKTLFIGNLSFEMSDQDLNNLFRSIRNVVDVRVAIDRRTGQPRGFAHAEFTDVESASAAIEALADKEAYGRKIRVDFSGGGLKTEGGNRGGFGGRGGRGDFGGRGGDRDGGRPSGGRGGFGGRGGGGRGGGRGGYGGDRDGGRSGGYGGDREGGRSGGYGGDREGGRSGGYGGDREGGRSGGYGGNRGGDRY